jgi:1,4-dihydroxy-2-naphthoate octaprenyltransferase
MSNSNKSWLNWPVFYALTEVYQVPLNIIWFIFSFGIAYNYYHLINGLNLFLVCLDVMLFDIAVNAADNYFDYMHATDQHFREVTNPVGRLQMPLNSVKKLVVLLYVISAIPGLFLVYRTGWQVLAMGIIGYFIGIFYTAGPKPLNATPFCEAIVSFFIAFFIVLVGVYVTIYQQVQLTWPMIINVFLLCLPLLFVFYALQLANNSCDLREDLANGRHTLASFIGQKRGFSLVKVLVILGYLMPLLLLGLKLVKWPVALTSLLLLLCWPKINAFFQHPVKNTTYLLLFKQLALFLIAYILIYVITAFI